MLILPHTAHASDVFGLAVTSKYVISASGESTLKIWDAKNPEHPLVHQFEGAHRLGIHHVAVSRNGNVAATAGYEGGLKIWDLETMEKKAQLGRLYTYPTLMLFLNGRCIEQPADGDIWAVALNTTGELVSSTTHDGRIIIRDVRDLNTKVGEYTTKGSFGLCMDTVGILAVLSISEKLTRK